MSRGVFITLEGGEGAGKSTQGPRLKTALEARGRPVVLTREPGGSPGAEEIRALLVQGEPERWTPMSETLLFLAARADHVARLIEPALARGDWVICDRFSDSTAVYQGIARGLGVARVKDLQRAALGDFQPDLTILLDIAPETGLARATGRGLVLMDEKGAPTSAAENRFERFGLAFHEKLRQGFLSLAAGEPRRYAIVDAAGNAGAIASEIWRIVSERLSP